MSPRASKPTDPLELLRGAPIGVATPHEVELERARVVPWLEQQVALFPLERARARRRRRWVVASAVAGGSVAAAAVVALVWSFRPDLASQGSSNVAGVAGRAPGPEGPSVQLVEGSVESQAAHISAGSRFAASSQVRTNSAQRAVFVGEGGYRVALSPETELSFGARPSAASVATRLELLRGEVELSVPKLAPGRTLEVHTPSATVRVRGTRFGVALRPDGDTCVRVTEGLVEVERSSGTVFVATGQDNGCEGPSVDRGAPAGAVGAAARSRAQVPASTLSEESRWLGLALGAERAGDRAAARRAYAELLKRYPATRFAPEARAGLARTAESAAESAAE